MWKALFLIIVISILSWFGYDHYRENVGKPGLDARAVISDIQGKFSNLKAIIAEKTGSGETADSANDSQATNNGDSDSSDTETSSQDNGSQDTSQSAEAVSGEASPVAKITIMSKEAIDALTDNAEDEADGTSAEATLTLIKEEVSVDDSTEIAKASKDSTDDDSNDVSNTSAAIAMPEVPLTLGALSRQVGNTIGSTQRILEGVTDSESATAAVPKLEAINDSLSSLSQAIPDIPDVAKAPMANLVGQGVTRIQPLVDKTSQTEGVGEILNPVLGKLMNTFSELSQ